MARVDMVGLGLEVVWVTMVAAGIGLFASAGDRLPVAGWWGGLCLIWGGGVLLVLTPILWGLK